MIAKNNDKNKIASAYKSKKHFMLLEVMSQPAETWLLFCCLVWDNLISEISPDELDF